MRPLSWLPVILLAAGDALRYAVGSFEEPDHMPFRLSSGACRPCHVDEAEKTVLTH